MAFAFLRSTAIMTRSGPLANINQHVLYRNPIAPFGFFKQSEYVHWETPFGTDDSLPARRYKAYSADRLNETSLVDASYLVEPEKGLWLLMLDANVYKPRNGGWALDQKNAFLDSSHAGWNSVLVNKPHLLRWISGVCDRAKRTGKVLLCFSHYPIIDAFSDTKADERYLFSDTERLKRTPDERVARQLLDSGLRLHFGGHLHIHNLSSYSRGGQTITDCATPSLVGFPPAFNIVYPYAQSARIETVELSSMTLDPELIAYYRRESEHLGDENNTALYTSDYGKFLYHRMRSRVVHHYLPKEWPNDIANAVLNSSTAELAQFMISDVEQMFDPDRLPQTKPTHTASLASKTLNSKLQLSIVGTGLSVQDLINCSMIQLVADWYCLRNGGCLSRQYISMERIRLYAYLSDQFGNRPTQPLAAETAHLPGPAEQRAMHNTPPIATATGSHREFFSVFLSILGRTIKRSKTPVQQDVPLW